MKLDKFKTEKVKRCCGVKLERYTKGFGHLIEVYVCAKCGDSYSPFSLTRSSKGGLKYSDVKVADYLESPITWLRYEEEEE